MNTLMPTIGIECHVQLKTKTKLFDGVDNDARDAKPNTLIGPLCFGLPGSLPVLNAKAVELAIRAGIALDATVSNYSKFDRKHYFYPDLPKGYQITQYDQPIIVNGKVETVLQNGETSIVRIERAHLEEDAGKSIHPSGSDYSLVDLNRAGTPLLEIVSCPDIHSAQQAKSYVRELYLLMRYANVSDADLFQGNMRFDINVSVSKDLSKLGVRCEIKNLNSFRSVEKAVEYEIKRQSELLASGKKVIQETRGWDDVKQRTYSQRTKEDAHDYRYFPDPDIPPLIIDQQQIDDIKNNMPIMPNALRRELCEVGMDRSQTETILDNPEVAEMMHYLISSHDSATARTIGNWLTGEILRLVSDSVLDWGQVVNALAGLVKLASMQDGSILSSTAAKSILEEVIREKSDPEKIAKSRNLMQVSDQSELVLVIESVLSENQTAVDDVKNGQEKAIGYLVGQVMKASGGSANPAVVAELIRKQLSN